MADVYVLSARENLGNSDWGVCDEVAVMGVYDSYEKGVEAFRKLVVSIAEELAESQGDFQYSEDVLFEDYEGGEDCFGWECYIGKSQAEWIVFIPESDGYNYGFWLNPIVILEKRTVE